MRASRFRDDDSQLVEAISGENHAAIEYFFNRFEKLIYSMINRHSWTHRQDVNDLYNSFFVHLAEDKFRRVCAWKRQAALGTYIVALLQNHIQDYYKSRRSRPTGTEPIDETSPDDRESADELFDLMRLREYLVDAKKSLSDRDRKILCLKLFRDLEPAVCASELGLNIGAFYTAYHRAERRLIDAFRNLYPLLFEKNV